MPLNLTRFGSLILLTFSLLMVMAFGSHRTAAGSGGAADEKDLARMRARLEGTFELIEWGTEGKVLRPPEVEGRFSIHDGVILFMTKRSDGSILESVHGWGEYTIDARGWTYGYQRLETMRAGPDGRFTQSLRPPVAATVLKLSWDGDKLMVVAPEQDDRRASGVGRDVRTYWPNEFLSAGLNASNDYRRWRRIGAAR